MKDEAPVQAEELLRSCQPVRQLRNGNDFGKYEGYAEECQTISFRMQAKVRAKSASAPETLFVGLSFGSTRHESV